MGHFYFAEVKSMFRVVACNFCTLNNRRSHRVGIAYTVLRIRKFLGSSFGQVIEYFNNNISFRQTHLVCYFIIIRVAKCFDPIGSSSGLHYEPANCKAIKFYYYYYYYYYYYTICMSPVTGISSWYFS